MDLEKGERPSSKDSGHKFEGELSPDPPYPKVTAEKGGGKTTRGKQEKDPGGAGLTGRKPPQDLALQPRGGVIP